jgi:hypothetical protein
VEERGFCALVDAVRSCIKSIFIIQHLTIKVQVFMSAGTHPWYKLGGPRKYKYKIHSTTKSTVPCATVCLPRTCQCQCVPKYICTHMQAREADHPLKSYTRTSPSCCPVG